MKRPIAIGLSPDTQGDDVFAAFKQLIAPWHLLRGADIAHLEQWFRQYFSVSYAVSFTSGRGALYVVLKSLGITSGDEVLLQAFTCVAVPNAVIWTGAKPIYVDITDNLTINPADLEKKITKKTKAIIVQHTFGIPADMPTLQAISQKYKIPIIEDVAHTIGGTINHKKLGTFGTASIFSFGRDKAFSSVFGGVAVTNDEVLGKKIRSLQRSYGYPSVFWILQQLLHPIAFSTILPFYNILSLGKVLLVILQKLHFLSFPVTNEEKDALYVPVFIKKFPNALASLAYHQIKKLQSYNAKREKLVTLYLSEFSTAENITVPYKQTLPLLRFPLLIKKRDMLLSFAQKQGIYIGTWYANVIDPKGVDFSKIFYENGSCPHAEEVAQQIVNLPTYPTLLVSQAKNVIQLVNHYAVE